MRSLFVFIALVTCHLFTTSQEPSDTTKKTITDFGGEGTLTFTNTDFGEFYSGGGLSSTSVGALLNGYLNQTYDNGGIFENILRVDYGVSKIEKTNDERFTKSSDVIDLFSKYGTPVKRSDKLYYAAVANVLTQLTDTRTQFQNGEFQQLIGLDNQEYGTRQSSLFAPGDITLAIGLDYNPNEKISAFYGPLSGKVRIVSEDNIANSQLFGNDFGERTRFEAGSSAFVNYTDQFLHEDMLSFTSGLKLFSNYLEDPQNVDINWHTITSLNPWKFVTLSYSTDIAYDDNKQFTAAANGDLLDGPRRGLQFRSVAGIGFIHKFGNSK